MQPLCPGHPSLGPMTHSMGEIDDVVNQYVPPAERYMVLHRRRTKTDATCGRKSAFVNQAHAKDGAPQSHVPISRDTSLEIAPTTELRYDRMDSEEHRMSDCGHQDPIRGPAKVATARLQGQPNRPSSDGRRRRCLDCPRREGCTDLEDLCRFFEREEQSLRSLRNRATCLVKRVDEALRRTPSQSR